MGKQKGILQQHILRSILGVNVEWQQRNGHLEQDQLKLRSSSRENIFGGVGNYGGTWSQMPCHKELKTQTGQSARQLGLKAIRIFDADVVEVVGHQVNY